MSVFTENGAPSYPADDPLLEIFYKALRNTPQDKMRDMVKAAWSSCSDNAIRKLQLLKVIFHMRWCRGGKGERKMFHIALDELIKCGAKQHIFNNLGNIPYFGYWKDLWSLLGSVLEMDMINFYSQQLRQDLNDLSTGQISLAAKWAPSEGKALDKQYNVVAKMCSALKINKHQYRTRYLVPLRKHLELVEQKMCSGEWQDINYSAVPSLARFRYTQSFNKHDSERFEQYMKDVAAGRAKMNIKLLFPYQIVEKIMRNDVTISAEQLNVMWNELVRQIREDLVSQGANLQAIAVADLSGSMQGVPMYNSVAMSLLWADLCQGQFHNYCYVFSRTAKLVQITGNTIKQKVENLMRHAEVANTNFGAVFENMLNNASMWSLPKELYPKKVYVFTDGQFDSMVNDSAVSNHDAIIAKHSRAGYPMPEIIYWNLRGDTVDFPSPGNRKGVVMLSGFSPSLLKLVMKGENLTPSGMMMMAIADPELNKIVL